MSDKQLILALIQPFVNKNLLLSRVEEKINLEEFTFIKENNKLIACAGLKPYPLEKMSEIYCFAVAQDYQRLGYGQKLLDLLMKKSPNKLFALSKFGGDWFLKQGFVLGELNQLPNEKQQQFDKKRNPNIFIKC